MTDILERRGWLGLLVRLTVHLTAPIWGSVLVVCWVLSLIFVYLPYYLWTGEEL